MPESVALAMAEVTGAMQEGLLALPVGAGLQAMAAFMEESVTELTDPTGRHDLNRVAGRHAMRALRSPRAAAGCRCGGRACGRRPGRGSLPCPRRGR